MPAPTDLMAAAPYDGPRAAAADFFILARTGRSQTMLPPLRNGDSVSCPRGNEWMRYDGRWIVPGRPDGLSLSDRTVTGWWHTRHLPGSRFALVHRLTSTETDLITHGRYISSHLIGGMWSQDPVSGSWLRQLAWEAALALPVSVHLELPTGIVTLHSRHFGDVFFHPDTPASTPVPERRPGRPAVPPEKR
ncbi:hypothetical protein ACIQF5_21625 [Streptomyces goshikiensis]|uniref:hypothetical protein n=1 Tax=Streptomyces goshikiensis TaxID=1942 RepID=UPI0038146554